MTTPTPSQLTIIRVQAISGLVFATFLGLHLLNTVVAGAGQGPYDGYQGWVRWYYQLPLLEPLLIVGAAGVHIWAGVTRILQRRRAGLPAPPWRLRLHRWSAYFLLLFVGAHALATRGPSLFFGVPVDLSYLTFSLSHWPWAFYPYYMLLALSGLYHLANGTLFALGVLGVRVPAIWRAPRSKPFFFAVAAGYVCLLVGIVGLGGHLFAIDTRHWVTYQALYERFWPAFLLPWSGSDLRP